MTEPAKPYELVLLADGRKWINANDRLYWMQKAKITRQWRELAHMRAQAEQLPYIGQARIVCELQFSDSRRRDPANWAPTAKAAIDGLVDARIFTDDDSKHLIGPDMRLGERVIGANIGMRLLIWPLHGKSYDDAVHDALMRVRKQQQLMQAREEQP